MSRLRKRFLLLGTVMTLAVIAVGLAVALLRSSWLAEHVRRRIVSELETATGGRAEVAAFRFDWRALTADIAGLVVHGLEDKDEPALFEAGSVTVRLKIVSLMRRDIDLAAIRLDSPRLYLRIDEKGNSNLPTPRRPRRDKRAMEEFLSLAVDEYIIRQGEVRYNSARTPVDAEGKNLALKMTYSAEGPSYDAMLATDDLRIAAPLSAPVRLGLRADFRLDSESVEVRRADFLLARSKLTANGRMENFAKPAARMEFNGDLAVEDLAGPLRLPLAPAGRVKASGTARFGDDSSWSVAGRVEAAGLALKRQGVVLEGIRGSARFRATPPGLEIGEADIEALGGKFQGSVSLENWRELRSQGQLTDLPSGALAAALGRESLPVSTRISGPLELESAIDGRSLQDIRVKADLVLTEGEGELPVTGAIHAVYAQRTEELEFSESHLALGRSRVNFHGELERGIRCGVFSADLGDFAPLLKAAGAAPADLPFALEGGVLRWDGILLGALSNPEIEGRLEV